MDKNDIRLYRDDSIGIIHGISKPIIERKKKLIVKNFKQCGLAITIECNLKTVSFLDITFDLQNNVYKPYRFDKFLKLYQDALKDSDFSNDLSYIENNNTISDNKRKTKRKIIWFNPPFSKSVKNNISKSFFQLLSKHFHKNHNMHKSFNRNTVKISYSCMKNIASIILAHNRNILNPIVQSHGCNCRVKSSCPLNGECLTPKIIYRVDVSNDKNSKKKFYFRLADTPFKKEVQKPYKEL